MRKLFGIILIFSCCRAGAQSPCGTIIKAPALPENTRKEFEQKRAIAHRDYKADSNDADNIIWYGRRTAYTGEYLEAIGIFTSGIRKHPDDARMYRHRGHRYITIRCFDLAIADLEKATELILGKYDEIEPDGLPNAKNIPTSTLHSNIWYHLGLAYFVKGEHRKAFKAYKRCLEVAENDDMYVATANWTILTLMKLGKERRVKLLLKNMKKEPELIENFDYWKLVSKVYQASPSESQIDAIAAEITKESSSLGNATLNFGIGFYSLTRGYREKAKQYFEKAVASGNWASFGYISAEAELKRLN